MIMYEEFVLDFYREPHVDIANCCMINEWQEQNQRIIKKKSEDSKYISFWDYCRIRSICGSNVEASEECINIIINNNKRINYKPGDVINFKSIIEEERDQKRREASSNYYELKKEIFVYDIVMKKVVCSTKLKEALKEFTDSVDSDKYIFIQSNMFLEPEGYMPWYNLAGEELRPANMYRALHKLL